MLRCIELGLQKMFVYGTLLKGQPNHHVLMNANNGLSVFVGKARLTKKYPLVVASAYNVPYLLPLKGTGQEVHGEVYGVDSKMLRELDALEEHPEYYTRTPVYVHADRNVRTIQRSGSCWTARSTSCSITGKSFLAFPC
eukprot:Em0026g37a